MKTYTDIDSYIASFPPKSGELMQQLRAAIKRAAPEAEESISYGIPAFKTCGKPLVYFAAYKNHIGFYATPTGHQAFAEELSKFRQGKGSVQFPIGKPFPFDLIERITRFRAEENKAGVSRQK